MQTTPQLGLRPHTPNPVQTPPLIPIRLEIKSKLYCHKQINNVNAKVTDNIKNTKLK